MPHTTTSTSPTVSIVADAAPAWITRIDPPLSVCSQGPLAGLRFAIKDNMDLAGVPTTAACPAFSHQPEATATVVQALLDAGAALVGKHFWCVTTTGGAQSAYAADGIHGFDYETFLAPLVQTVRLCGMHWLPPWIIHGAPQLSSAELQDWVARYRDRLTRYPAWLTAA